MKNIITLLFAVTLLFACKTEEKQEKEKSAVQAEIQEKTHPFADKIEKAHKKEAFLNYDAIAFDTEIAFGGNTILQAKITVATNSSYAKIEMENGEKIYINEDKIFVSPGLKENPSSRFNAYTWTYFFLLPYKLSDKGVLLNEYTTQHRNEDYTTNKLSFEANIGDAPDDWYVLYANKNTHVLEVAAYIVTLGKTQKEAEKDPHAIKYENFINVNDVPFATKWSFWGWKADKGLTQQIGEASIKNIQFIDGFKAELAKIPSDFIEK